MLLIKLGIDEYDCHQVQLDYRSGHYDETCYVVDEAIEALEAIRQQLAALASTAASCKPWRTVAGFPSK